MKNIPKPPEIKLLEGHRGHRPIKKSITTPKADKFPNPPEWLDDIGKKEWIDKGKILGCQFPF